MNKKKLNKKPLLVIIGGGINENYNNYNNRVKIRFKVRQVKPYVLEFPRELTEEELKKINDWLDKIETKYEWFTILK